MQELVLQRLKVAKIIDAAGTDRTNFYHITYQPANLTVEQLLPVVVVIKGEKKSKVYDGETATIGYKVTEIQDTSGLYKESDISFNGASADQTVKKKDAGILTNYLLQNRLLIVIKISRLIS